MVLDKQVIQRRLADMDRKLTILRRYSGMSPEEFNSDSGRILAVQHALQTLIQAILDIAIQILTDRAVGRMETYGSVLESLADEKIISSELIQRLRGMIGFRNILVHEYTTVDEEQVKHFMRTRLDDFHLFQETVKGYLASR